MFQMPRIVTGIIFTLEITLTREQGLKTDLIEVGLLDKAEKIMLGRLSEFALDIFPFIVEHGGPQTMLLPQRRRPPELSRSI